MFKIYGHGSDLRHSFIKMKTFKRFYHIWLDVPEPFEQTCSPNPRSIQMKSSRNQYSKQLQKQNHLKYWGWAMKADCPTSSSSVFYSGEIETELLTPMKREKSFAVYLWAFKALNLGLPARVPCWWHFPTVPALFPNAWPETLGCLDWWLFAGVDAFWPVPNELSTGKRNYH